MCASVLAKMKFHSSVMVSLYGVCSLPHPISFIIINTLQSALHAVSCSMPTAWPDRGTNSLRICRKYGQNFFVETSVFSKNTFSQLHVYHPSCSAYAITIAETV